MIGVSVRVQVDTRATEAFRKGLRAKLARAVATEAHALQADAQSRVSVKTGTLRRSIRAEAVSDLTWKVATHTDYAAHVEYGTHKMAARPYMTPAAEVSRRRFPRRVRDVLGGAA